ncbi:transcriptional regulator, GntR family [Desulfocicer vacuolatum DSM 3385]|uniref:Transcriptional regulator, GntR family n=1 Tax=Desulfocicer vacuolatum DSM 3385 TaxID=1121400 RepID=A0A1W2AYT3_9BACT|nr:GntR family transcriptional regulator [Desulfocicer vacuolatum]SMC65348.1 transcriptional regulator, GntR family [Desulfocicer vacuolatum DSM 3385]
MELTELNKPEPLAKMAYNALRGSILSNTLTSGTIYNEKNLAQQLGISRTPVREALLELSSQGLIEFLPRKGVVVNSFKPQDINEIFELRQIIETHTFKMVCTQSATIDFTEIDQCLADQRRIAMESADIAKFMEIDRAFHMAFARQTGNRRLIAIMDNIRDILHIMGSYALVVEGRMNQVVLEHENILKAVKAGDVDTALTLLSDHLSQSKAAVSHQAVPHSR